MGDTGRRRRQETRGCMRKASTLKEVKRKMWDPFFLFTPGRLRAQSQVSSLNATFLHLKTAHFSPRCRWRLGGFHVAKIYDNLSVKLLAHAGRSGWVCGSQLNELLSILGVVLCVRQFPFCISLSTWSLHTCLLKLLQASGLVKLSIVNWAKFKNQSPVKIYFDHSCVQYKTPTDIIPWTWPLDICSNYCKLEDRSSSQQNRTPDRCSL